MCDIFRIDSNSKYLTISKNFPLILDIKTKNFINQYKKICFVDNYNEKIIWLPTSIKIIRFEVDYEYPLDNLPDELVKLVFVFTCNQKMDNLPMNLKIIYFGMNFNQSLDMLPESIEEIYLLATFNLPIDNLPIGLKVLTLSNNFSYPIYNLPRQLKELSLGDSFVHPLINLPSTIQTIKLGNGFSSKITQLPQKLKQIIIPSKYKYIDEFKLIWNNFHQINESHGMITFIKMKLEKNLNNEIKKCEPNKSIVDTIILEFEKILSYIQYDIFE
jgi:hypothetical protein